VNSAICANCVFTMTLEDFADPIPKVEPSAREGPCSPDEIRARVDKFVDGLRREREVRHGR